MHGVFRSDGGSAAQERVLTPLFIVSMSPPGYPSAWLRPRSAAFGFARQNYCTATTSGLKLLEIHLKTAESECEREWPGIARSV